MTRVVGQRVPRIDGPEKVTGRARYTVDLVVPGMLHGAVLRSPIPHGRIRAIDASRAEALPGVVAVLTRDDVRDIDPYYGHLIRDCPLIAVDKVRYVGEPVAAVASLDNLTAREALDLIDVDYEDLPPVLDIQAALSDGATLVHEATRRLDAGGRSDPLQGETPARSNVCYRARYERGDVDSTLVAAPHVFEQTFTFPMIYQYAMEPHTVIASVEGDRITVWTSAQHPFLIRAELARLFRRSLEQVRVVIPYVGGGFGSKSYIKVEPLVVALARKAGRPVRVALTVGEAMLTTRRHAARVVLRTGVDAEGRLLAREAQIRLDTGAYADNGPRVAAKAAGRVLGAYRCDNVRVDAAAVYTNTVPAGSMRSIGGPQTIWATESHLDLIAQTLGIDPLQVRLRNLLRKGEGVGESTRPLDADLADGLRRVAAVIGWGQTPPPGIGRGLALGIADSGAEPIATAIVRLHDDGSITVHESSTELGQGVRTILAQIAAEELMLPLDRIGIVATDTGSTPYDRSTGASRSTTLMGLAVQEACRDLRAQLAAAVAEHLGCQASEIAFDEGRVVGPGARTLAYGEAVRAYFGMTGGELVGRGYIRAATDDGRLKVRPVFWEVGWGAAEVSVDEDTGQVELRRYVSAADVGKAINPQLAEAQDEGAAMMGIGHTFFEALQYENGQLVNGSLLEYRVPLMADLPEAFDSLLVEAANGPGAFGAKGMGEGAINPVAPAVASAVLQVCQVRITDLPLTPERVWRALQDRTQEKHPMRVG